VNIPNNVGIQIHVAQEQVLGIERFRNLGKDAREALQYLRKSKSYYSLKAYRKHYSGFPKLLLGTEENVCG
jgi:hypothetical protein